jgi:hypothetical protein
MIMYHSEDWKKLQPKNLKQIQVKLNRRGWMIFLKGLENKNAMKINQEGLEQVQNGNPGQYCNAWCSSRVWNNGDVNRRIGLISQFSLLRNKDSSPIFKMQTFLPYFLGKFFKENYSKKISP